MSDLVERALAEDIGEGDVTTRAVVPDGAQARAVIRQKEPGVIAGMGVMREVFLHVDAELEYEAHCPEAKWREEGSVAQVTGAAASILAAERVALNFLGRLSGIATLTARYVRTIDGTGARILDTRKTTPGLRDLEKAAVRAGGGMSHRRGLYDAILVKENHSALAGGVGEAARLALAAASELPAPAGRQSIAVEVEASTLGEVEEALTVGVPSNQLDHMSLDELRRAVKLADGRAELEASGDITLETVRAVAETGVDYISVGALTHSAPALDVSLLLEPL
jgi:nicotinate-nucleotide pyrophosphorylase (carboxylating)